MKKIIVMIVSLLALNLLSAQQNYEISSQSQECIDCHSTITPGIVGDWKKSRHFSNSPSDAVKKPSLTKRISIENIEKIENGNFVVGCYECHSLNPEFHKDNFEHFGFKINIIVSPNDCKTCHPAEVEQYTGSKKYHAYDNLIENPVYHTLVNTITSVKSVNADKQLIPHEGTDLVKGETCLACHGTKIEVKGLKTVDTEMGEIDVPDLTNWPNQGVGRLNPDGSKGSCTSCHPRHNFSIETARKPYTCGQCHLEPDVPAYNVYKESKHGNIFESQNSKWNFESVPWMVGEDFTSPTCASCHNSLLVNGDEEIIAERSHDFGRRLWVRIFGLPYSHPQPKSGNTAVIVNKDNLPLPTSFDGVAATDYLINSDEQQLRMEAMGNVCKSCHGSSWVNLQFKKINETNLKADEMVKTATLLLSEAWNNKLADNSNPFDEKIEILWQKQWLFYANSVRYATAMMGPDYAAFKNGWWSLSENLREMHDKLDKKSKK